MNSYVTDRWKRNHTSTALGRSTQNFVTGKKKREQATYVYQPHRKEQTANGVFERHCETEEKDQHMEKTKVSDNERAL